VREQALIAYAKTSARRKHGAEATKAICALKRKMGEVDDPVYGALRATRAEEKSGSSMDTKGIRGLFDAS
jgi:hypothetical protein